MTIISRRIETKLSQDLNKKLVFLSGPRQCGKTTLSQNLNLKPLSYYNWDIEDHNILIKRREFNPNAKLWVFDELHKYRSWRNFLKNLSDQKLKQKILVTGSARLDIFSRGGDSLQGRYYWWRLHPFTLSEITKSETHNKNFEWSDETFDLPQNINSLDQDAYQQLWHRGGFPEPFQFENKADSERWRLMYGRRLVQEEIHKVEQFEQLDKIELLYDRLQEIIGSPLSINALREDLQSSHLTVSKWLRALERNYAHFYVFPFGLSKIKAVKKSPKLYLWDWARIDDESARFENMIAVHLIRYCHWLEDAFGEKAELRYFRSDKGHEVDFIVIKKNKILFCVECKLDDRPTDKGLLYFLERSGANYAFQVTHKGNKDYTHIYKIKMPSNKTVISQVRHTSAARLLLHLP